MRPLPRHPQGVREKAERFVKSNDSDYQQIRVAAYFKAQQRGFAPDHELDDWLEAERDFNSPIASCGSD
jgi:hypothetical protein